MTVLSLCAYAFEQLVQWKYGVAGTIAFGLLAVGRRSDNATFTCIGLVVMVLLLSH